MSKSYDEILYSKEELRVLETRKKKLESQMTEMQEDLENADDEEVKKIELELAEKELEMAKLEAEISGTNNYISKRCLVALREKIKFEASIKSGGISFNDQWVKDVNNLYELNLYAGFGDEALGKSYIIGDELRLLKKQYELGEISEENYTKKTEELTKKRKEARNLSLQYSDKEDESKKKFVAMGGKEENIGNYEQLMLDSDKTSIEVYDALINEYRTNLDNVEYSQAEEKDVKVKICELELKRAEIEAFQKSLLYKMPEIGLGDKAVIQTYKKDLIQAKREKLLFEQSRGKISLEDYKKEMKTLFEEEKKIEDEIFFVETDEHYSQIINYGQTKTGIEELEKLYATGKKGEEAELAKMFADFDLINNGHLEDGLNPFGEGVGNADVSGLFPDRHKYNNVEPDYALTSLEKMKGIKTHNEQGEEISIDEDIYVLTSTGLIDGDADKEVFQKQYYVKGKDGKLSLLGASIGDEFVFNIDGNKVQTRREDIELGDTVAKVKQPDLMKNMSRTHEELDKDKDKDMLKHDYLMEEITEEELQQAYQDLARSKNERTQENNRERE